MNTDLAFFRFYPAPQEFLQQPVAKTGSKRKLPQLVAKIASAGRRTAPGDEGCPARTIGQQPADQLSWFHIVVLITRLSKAEALLR